MKLLQIPLKVSQLKSNFSYWMDNWKKVEHPEDLVKGYCSEIILPTHSFPFQKETDTEFVIPYESILSRTENNGILSNGLRELLKINPDNNSTSRNIPAGLKNYVFAYLGIHQPYYAKIKSDKIGLMSKPFGIFIKNHILSEEIEKFPYTHASRRDFGSPEVRDTSIEFLLPENARTLISYQICNDPNHEISAGSQIDRFWHYYGNPEYWKNSDYANNSWNKKAEFRYFEKVDPKNIAAILWPVWKDGEGDKYSITHDDLAKYSQLFPTIKFITYDLDLTDPEICFIEASYVALKYYLVHNNIFPENISIAKEILNI